MGLRFSNGVGQYSKERPALSTFECLAEVQATSKYHGSLIFLKWVIQLSQNHLGLYWEPNLIIG